MREIRFRGWNKATKRMIDPQKLTPLALNSDCKDLKGVFLPFHDDVELMQFTGLHDKNGKEIWEGDIVENPHNEIGKVVFSNGSFWMEFFPPYNWDPMEPAILLDCKNFEVIGDIYQNPELIKENP